MTDGSGSYNGAHFVGREQRSPEGAADYVVDGGVPTVTRSASSGEIPPMARPYVAAGALFFDDDGRVMLVEPSYKPGWDIPGGFVEPGESPYSACVREVEEELGITPPIGELLAVDWAPRPKDGWLEGEMLLFVFDGGLLPAAWRERIRLDMDELVNFAFVPVDEVDRLLPPLHARRVAAAARLRRTPHRAGYLEHGEQIPVQTLARGTAGRSAARRPPDPAPGPELADWPADLGALSVNTRESHG